MIKLYTVKDLQVILGMSQPTVLALIRDGKIKKLDTHGAIRVTEDALNKYLKGE